MKKILMVLMLVFALALSACSSTEQGNTPIDDESGTSTPVETETKELVFGSLGSFYNSSWDPLVWGKLCSAWTKAIKRYRGWQSQLPNKIQLHGW